MLYPFANLLLLALALTGLWQLADAARSGHFFAEARRRWRAEAYLLGHDFSAREKALQAAFLASLWLHLSCVILSSSLLPAKLPRLETVLDGFCMPVMLLLLLCKLIFSRYSWRQYLAVCMSVFIFRWVFFNSQDIWLFYAILFVAAAKDVSMKHAVQHWMRCTLLLVCCVIVLSLTGFLENTFWMDAYRERWYFGFTHPNTLGGFLMGIVCGWVILRAENWRWIDFGPLLAIELFNDFGPYVRSLQVVLRATLALLVLAKLLPLQKLCRPKALRLLFSLAPVWLMLFSLGMVFWYDHHPDDLIEYINICLTGRIYLQSQGFQLYPIAIAGQFMKEWPNQDNCFIAALLRYGPVVSAMIWAAACRVLWQLFRGGRAYTALIFLCMLMYAYFEIIFFHLPGNPALLLFAGALYALPPQGFTVAEPLQSPR